MPEYVWKIDVEYPKDALYETNWGGMRFDPNWTPANWQPDEEYIERFRTERFYWPSVRRHYLHRKTAVDRANLLEFYGCRVRLFRAELSEFEERDFKHVHRTLRVIPGGAA